MFAFFSTAYKNINKYFTSKFCSFSMSQTRHLLKTVVQSFVVVTLKNYDHGVVCLWHNINLALAVAFTLQNSKIHQFLKINMYAVDLFFADLVKKAFLKYHIRFLLRDLRAMLTCELAYSTLLGAYPSKH